MLTANKSGYNFPQRGDEYWKFTKPDQFVEISEMASPVNLENVIDAKSPSQTVATHKLDDIDRIEFVLHPNEFLFDQSDSRIVNSLQAEFNYRHRRKPSWIDEVSGAIENRIQKPIPRPFAKYCINHSQIGFCMWAKKEITDPVVLNYGKCFAGGAHLIHNIIRVSSGAKLTLVEIGNPWSGVNMVNEVHVEPRGEFNHIRIAVGNSEARSLFHQYAKVDESASLKSFSLFGGAPLTRNEHIIELPENDANAHVSGVFVGNGNVLQDDTVFIRHIGLNGTSRQVFRKVLNNGATGVFQGKIHVNPGSQKTDGYQKSQALLLDEKSQFLVKPELEIYADDVSCSHGSTCGSIDNNSLYYLRSRGISKDEAISMLSLGFLKEVLDEIESEEIVANLEDLLTDMVNNAI
ncbi:MAG: SufD family Fe-S cluster assembly protein [Rhodobacteraceae bacterium]|nr:SufD family Fe-S cluster assembly protein [Paracoccaceae bacterium]